MRIVTANVLALLLLSCVAQAGDLATDPNALFYDGTLWSGTTVIISDGPNGEGDYLQATIDYCVYAPGQFSYPDLGYTPTPDEFVYAYQVFVDPNAELVKFSVGMLESNEANNIGSFLMDGGVEPNSSSFGGAPPTLDTATWMWDETPLPVGAKSYGLAYSSVNVPMMFIGSIQDTGCSAMGELPSPSDIIPEPASLGLLLVGAVAGAWRRHRR